VDVAEELTPLLLVVLVAVARATKTVRLEQQARVMQVVMQRDLAAAVVVVLGL
jgi:hypothetical protein